MGMVVRTNTMAMNANRQLGVNNTQVAKSLEKLSSGFRINRAADDASGLAISEKMKAQIKGLEQASANSQDGISLVQTAEGAATEIHDMLNRMVELATKSANGTIQNEVDREAIQREVDDLNSEITRIASSTNFNGINLLDGNLAGGSSSGSVAGLKIGSMIDSAPGLTPVENAAVGQKFETASVGAITGGNEVAAGEKITISYKDSKGMENKVEVELGALGTGNGAAQANSIIDALKNSDLAKHFDIAVTGGDSDQLTFTAKNGETLAKINTTAGLNTVLADVKSTAYTKTEATEANVQLEIATNAFAKGDKINVNGQIYEFVAADGDKTSTKGAIGITLGTNAVETIKNLNSALTQKGIKAELINSTNGNTVAAAGDINANTVIQFTKPGSTSGTASSGGLALQVGDTNDEFNKVTVSVDDLSAKGIGTDGLDVSTQDAAGNAIQTIRDAINQVSTNRANLGSLQNRLEHTINNLDTTAENMTAANSRIRDTDMAKEMMNYTKMNVLVQSAQAMLAQANQQPQSILQLLQ